MTSSSYRVRGSTLGLDKVLLTKTIRTRLGLTLTESKVITDSVVLERTFALDPELSLELKHLLAEVGLELVRMDDPANAGHSTSGAEDLAD